MDFLILDIHTTILLLAMGNLGAALTLLAYQGKVRADRPALLYLAALLSQALAWLLIGLRGQIPDILSIHAGNLTLLAGFNLGGLALASAEGRATRFDLAFAISAVTGGAAFCLLGRDPGLRVIVASLVSVPPFAILAAAMFGQTRKKERRDFLRLFIGSAALAYCPLLAFRAFGALEAGPGFSLMKPALFQSTAFIPLFLSMIIGTIGFILLLKRRSDRMLRESEEKYRTLVEKASEAIVIIQDGLFAFANPKASIVLGEAPGGLVGRRFEDCVWPEDRAAVVANHLLRLAGGNPPEAYDFRLLGRDGSEVWVSIAAARIEWQGRPAILSLLSDISARKRSEAEAERLLREKETLLREVHHRVKNNLAMATSLLSLQAESAAGKDPSAVLLDASNRLQSLVQLYELLNRSRNFEGMSARDFFEALLGQLAAVFPPEPEVGFSLEVEDFELDVNRLARLGLIVNEIVTNSMKYAFGPARPAGVPNPAGGGEREPEIRLSASLAGGRVCISCGDNGRGLPPGFDPAASPGLGTQLIPLLAGQLGAELRIESSPGAGTSYLLELPAKPGS
jgi:PAS domain S-box-containing protein